MTWSPRSRWSRSSRVRRRSRPGNKEEHMAHDYKTIIVSDADRIRRITLNRPEFLNAYNHVLCHEVTEAVDEYMKKDSLRCLVITGAGRGFCAGGDISGTEPADERAARINVQIGRGVEMRDGMHRGFWRWRAATSR